MNVALAITYHDPKGCLCGQIQRVLPALNDIFSGLAVRASYSANQQALARFTNAGAYVEQEAQERLSAPKLGTVRREAIALALHFDAPWVMYCDGDRALHWAERYPKELAQVVERLSEYDFTVLGRTTRAWDSHPRVQRDTEAIVNYVFQIVSGYNWDVMAAARGLSRRTVEAIRDRCFDEEISTDVSWPLFLHASGEFSLGYIETEGLEFETAARYSEAIKTAGSYDAWLKQRDLELERWIHRLDFARLHMEAMIPFARKRIG
jgi:hypothetical protein